MKGSVSADHQTKFLFVSQVLYYTIMYSIIPVFIRRKPATQRTHAGKRNDFFRQTILASEAHGRAQAGSLLYY